MNPRDMHYGRQEGYHKTTRSGRNYMDGGQLPQIDSEDESDNLKYERQ